MVFSLFSHVHTNSLSILNSGFWLWQLRFFIFVPIRIFSLFTITLTGPLINFYSTNELDFFSICSIFSLVFCFSRASLSFACLWLFHSTLVGVFSGSSLASCLPRLLIVLSCLSCLSNTAWIAFNCGIASGGNNKLLEFLLLLWCVLVSENVRS